MKRSINSLPNEVLSEVFVAGAYMPDGRDAQRLSLEALVDGISPFDPDVVRPTQFASLVSLVCKLWRNISTATPALWTQIRLSDAHVDFARSSQILARSKHHGIDINIDVGSWPVHVRTQRRLELCMDIMSAHMHHCSTLVISSPDFGCDTVILHALARCTAPVRLELLDLSHLHSDIPAPLFGLVPLRHLRRLQMPRRSVRTTARDLSNLLAYGSLTRLVALDLTSICAQERPGTPRVSLPLLHTLRLDIAPDALAHVLRALEMPALRALALNMTSLRDDALPAEAHAALHQLAGVTHVVLHDVQLGAADIERLYELLPGVRWMQVQFHYVNAAFFWALCRRRVLPQLETLVMFGLASRGISWDSVSALVRARTQNGQPLAALTVDAPEALETMPYRQVQESVEHLRVLWDPQEPYPVYF